jgi:hypothetical protein
MEREEAFMFEFTGLDPVVEFDEEHSLVTPPSAPSY